ncbi:MAG: hypothetical protein HQL32_09205 [Planctomycetes bacterium]|nr:hypothetical protein [Planctomycetota bacterium]
MRFLLLYSFLLFSFYSFISYKTPWCLLSFYHSFIIVAGIGLGAAYDLLKNKYLKLVFFIALGFLSHHLYQQSTYITKRFNADERNPYLYVHTSRDMKLFEERMEQITKITDKTDNLYIQIISPADQTWPLPWYLRNFELCGYWNNVSNITRAPKADIIILSESFHLDNDYLDDYQQEYFSLRPQILLEVYIRKALWDRLMEGQSQ